MTDEQKAEVVCEWLGLWKREMACGYWNRTFIAEFREFTCEHGQHVPHIIPCPPVLTDDAWAMRVLQAIHEKGHFIELNNDSYDGWRLKFMTLIIEPEWHADLRIAIIRAAYQLSLVGEQHQS